MKVLILQTLPPEEPAADRCRDEFDLQESAAEIRSALPGAAVAGVRGEVKEILDLLSREAPDVVFNLCEAPLGQPRLEPHAAALFEWWGVPFTGSGSEALALCRRKDAMKRLLFGAGVPVPGSAGFPCIVKPADEDGSAGIHSGSVCVNPAEAEVAATKLTGPVLVEEFLPGREFAVSLWGKVEPDYVKVGETVYSGGVRLLSYEAKWETESFEYLHSPLVHDTTIDSELHGRIVGIAKQAWRLAGVRGYAGIDIRLNSVGAPCVLDVNPNPALYPGIRICRAAEEMGWTWARFIQALVDWAA